MARPRCLWLACDLLRRPLTAGRIGRITVAVGLDVLAEVALGIQQGAQDARRSLASERRLAAFSRAGVRRTLVTGAIHPRHEC